MKLLEFTREEDLATANYDPSQDKVNGRKLGDVRKPKLTLRDINKLKKIRAMRDLDDARKEDLLGIMYGAPAADAAPGGGGMPF